MKDLLNKELKLATQPITYCFLAFGFMTMLPGYPILLGAFFLCLGIYQSYQSGRENNDILYTVLLPIKKSDAVKAKFLSVCFLEVVEFVLMVILTLVRMTLFADAGAYTHNALMNANPLFLGFVLVIFAAFNYVFVRGFFKTAYKHGVPFILFIAVSFLIVCIAEALHFFPGMSYLNATTLQDASPLWIYTLLGALIYVGVTFLAYQGSVNRFERVDF